MSSGGDDLWSCSVGPRRQRTVTRGCHPPSSQMIDVLMLLISTVPANDRPLPSPAGGHRLVAGARRARSRADECHRCAAFSNQQLALATVIDRGGRSATLHDRGHDLWILT